MASRPPDLTVESWAGLPVPAATPGHRFAARKPAGRDHAHASLPHSPGKAAATGIDAAFGKIRHPRESGASVLVRSMNIALNVIVARKK